MGLGYNYIRAIHYAVAQTFSGKFVEPIEYSLADGLFFTMMLFVSPFWLWLNLYKKICTFKFRRD